jgi:hypothetical protein
MNLRTWSEARDDKSKCINREAGVYARLPFKSGQSQQTSQLTLFVTQFISRTCYDEFGQ